MVQQLSLLWSYRGPKFKQQHRTDRTQPATPGQEI